MKLLRNPVLRTTLGIALAISAMGASNEGRRYEALNHQMMCTCGCAQILGECNHVGCPNSGPMLVELHKEIGSGMDDHAILTSFAQLYGPESLASPLFTKFNKAAWWIPPLVLLFGLFGALLMLRRWKRRPAAIPSTGASATAQNDLIERIRRETENQ